MLAAPLFADTGQRLIPAGSLVSCTTGDARVSSKNTAVGDPVLCKVEHKRGDFMLPYGSYLGGQFTEYKDPGHFVGKGWMQLEFDRLYVGDTAISIDAKVVDAPGYKVDAQGRVLGKGHEGRDIALWSIPILWPVDLLMLPMRGPRPTLKSETALTLRVMDDIQVPVVQEPQSDPYGLKQRPTASLQAPAAPTESPDAAPETANAAPNQEATPQAAYPYPYAYPYAVPVVVPAAPYGYYAAPPMMVGFGAGYIGRWRVAPGYGARIYAGRTYGYGMTARAGSYGYAARGGVVRTGAVSGAAVRMSGGYGGGSRAR